MSAHTPNECLGEITVFEKIGAPLTKRIALRDGKIVNDSSACRTANGYARREQTHPVTEARDMHSQPFRYCK
jgi:hypothetical protein